MVDSKRLQRGTSPSTAESDLKESDEDILNKAAAVAESAPPHPLPYVNRTLLTCNMSSLVNNSEYRKYPDDALREELGPVDIDIPGFYEAMFREVEGLDLVASPPFTTNAGKRQSTTQ